MMLILNRTRLGLLIRAGVEDREMVEALRDEKGIKKNTEFLKKEMHKTEKKADEAEAPAEK